MANATVGRVPAFRLGKSGIQKQRIHAPMQVLAAEATTPATNAQYPQPAHPRTIEVTTASVRAARSLAETEGNRIARFSSASGRTARPVRKIVVATARVT